MSVIKKNVEYLWHRQDISGEVFLCLYSYRSANIHVRIVKGDVSGEYFVSCYSPKFKLHGFNLRQLLVVTFVELQKLTNDPYHKSTIRQMLDYFEVLKKEPQLSFSD